MRARSLNFVYKQPKSQLEDLSCGGSSASTAPECAGLQSEPQRAVSSKWETLEEFATARLGRARPTDRYQQPTPSAHPEHPGKVQSSCPQDVCPLPPHPPQPCQTCKEKLLFSSKITPHNPASVGGGSASVRRQWELTRASPSHHLHFPCFAQD